MNKYLMIAAAGLMLGLSACAGQQGSLTLGGPGSAVGDAVQFTNADLDAALATAKANIQVSPNQMVVQCIPVFKSWLNSLPGAGGAIQISGLASGLEATLLVNGTVQQGVPDAVYVACGPLYAKVHGQLLKLIGAKALSVGTGGIF